MNNSNRSPLRGLWFYAFVLVAVILGASYLTGNKKNEDLPYSKVLALLDEGQASKAELQGYKLTLKLKKELKDGRSQIEVPVSPAWIQDLKTHLDRAVRADEKFTYDYSAPLDTNALVSGGFSLLSVIGMGLLLWFLMFRQMGDGKSAMNFGKSKARRSDPMKNPIRFSDVAGAEEEKHELQELVDFLKNPSKYVALGAKIPKGVLMVGPPGTGKTLLAKAVAGEAGVPFFSISGSDFVEMFVGVGASRVRELFEQAKKHAPSIIFIDEIDAVGRQRGAGLGGGHDEREQTLNQLLVEMDGFGLNEATIVIAATNRVDILDPALLRPGRFDRRVMVMRPDLRGREEILKVHARNKPLAAEVSLADVARMTPGFTGADLANLLNEAALLAARRDAKEILYSDISEAVFKVTIGPEKKSRLVSDKERRLTAYHEAGHALVIRSVSETDRVERVTIIPAGGAGGYTAHKSQEDLYYATKPQLLAEIRSTLGGRAAEEIIFGQISTGASSDLQHCNSVARDMIVRYGMSDELGNFILPSGNEVFLGRDYGHTTQYSEKMMAKVDEEVQAILAKAYAETLQILRDRSQALEAISQRLLEVDKIDELEFEVLYRANTSDELRAKDAVNPHRDEAYERLLAQKESEQVSTSSSCVEESSVESSAE